MYAFSWKYDQYNVFIILISELLMGYTYGRQYKAFQPSGARGHYYCEGRGQNFNWCLCSSVGLITCVVNKPNHAPLLLLAWCVTYIRHFDKMHSVPFASEIRMADIYMCVCVCVYCIVLYFVLEIITE